jgi:hypothetical protein
VYPNADEYWYGDPTTVAAGLAQWNLDSSNFFNGVHWELTDTSGFDENDFDAAEAYYDQDYENLFRVYDDQYSTYQSDSTAHANGTDVPYSQIWNQTQADTDANDALQEWLNECSPPVPPTGILTGCCLHIALDTIAADFNDPLTAFAETVNNLGQPGFPTCSETECPYFARFVNVNTTSAFFYQSDIPREQHPDTSYILHPVPKWGFYTGQSGHPLVYTGFSAYSFYQLAEHEIGHFLGMHHPEQLANGTACSNCYTHNPLWTKDSLGDHILHPTGFHTVMAQGNNMANSSPMALTNEDDCQFQKLYCPGSCITHGGSCALDGVSQPTPVQDWFNPEVFPNPSNGGMTLTFTTIAESLTQISIYDILGNQVSMVFEGYLNAGPQSISLGTESLRSGNYVCRVRVGDQVNYINLAITK